MEETKTETTGHSTPHPSDVLDMPVDPNEPTYCLCHQVSYGEMIGCDNPDVSLGVNDDHQMRFSFRIIYSFLFLFLVSDWMVSFCLRWTHNKTEGQMVLSEVFARSKEKIMMWFTVAFFHLFGTTNDVNVFFFHHVELIFELFSFQLSISNSLDFMLVFFFFFFV